MTHHRLTDDQIAKAREMWAAGDTLDTIATALTCSIYDLAPWLYHDDTTAAPFRISAQNPKPLLGICPSCRLQGRSGRNAGVVLVYVAIPFVGVLERGRGGMDVGEPWGDFSRTPLSDFYPAECSHPACGWKGTWGEARPGA